MFPDSLLFSSLPSSLAAFLHSIFQGWWLWLESRHRWQASLPSGEGLHSLNFLSFPLFPFFFSSSSAQSFGPQLFTFGRPLSQRPPCEGTGSPVPRGWGGAGGKLSTDQWDHRYQWNLNRGASKVSLAAINSLII